MTADFHGARVVAGQLFQGYDEALSRFRDATRQQNADPGFRALFESLNWAVALDDFLRKVWKPGDKTLGWGGRAFAGGKELEDLLNGARYARNLVHHHWADALYREEGFRFPMRSPIVSFTWAWRDADDLPDHPNADDEYVMRNRDAYSRRLAGVRAEDTLIALGGGFGSVRRFLDPPRPSSPMASA